MTRVSFTLALKLLDGAFAVAEKIIAWNTARKAQKAKGLPFKDVARINAIARRAGHENEPGGK